MEHMIAEEEPKIIECGEEVEIPKDIDGEPGPRYKRGRGRSFFKNGARKGLCCQGMLYKIDLGGCAPNTS